ncbi:DUF6153 family protein [Leucobacter chromiireducens]|uniref:DUF6153 family protein n=1 Tax=Leucobacter chromiireducens TaxID=283877 RepID=UPI000F63609E|nr:DUF6153 family protein [Leucobacter chromiireducens]
MHQLAVSLRLRSLPFVVLALGLIIGGLVAMHVLTPSSAHAGHAVAVPSPTAEPHVTSMAGHDRIGTETGVAGAADCDAACGNASGGGIEEPLHPLTMWMMGCVIALFTAVLLLLPLLRRTVGGTRARISWRTAAIPIPPCAHPPPPSLIVLSISRT